MGLTASLSLLLYAGKPAMKRALIEGREADLSDAKSCWLGNSHSDGKGGLHGTGPRHWMVFCCYVIGINPFPPRCLMMQHEWQVFYEDKLEDCFTWTFLCKPSGRPNSADSCYKYNSETRGAYRRMRQIRLGLPVECCRIPDMVKGCKRSEPQPPKLERWGVTPADLAGSWVALGCRRVWRALTAVLLTGLMRGCEGCLMDGETFDATQNLVPADVQTVVGGEGGAVVAGGGVERTCVLRMRKRKDLKMLRGKHDKVVLASALDGAFFCVVTELEAWLAERRALGIPEGCALFCHDDGKPVMVRELRDMVKALMGSVGLDPARFGAHSLRIGGATAALAAGVPPALIRIMGRWSSDVYEIYCRMSLQSAVGVGRAISSATVDAPAMRFRTEELELTRPEMADAYGVSAALERDELDAVSGQD